VPGLPEAIDTRPIFSFDEASSGDRLSDRATDQLRSLIITLQLEPGVALDEAELSQLLGCGRTPLREAIQRLTEERLVIVLPRRSAAVAPITVTDLQHVYETRMCVEAASARLAALRATPSQLRAIEENVQTLTSGPQGNLLHVVRSDFAFHSLVARGADNQYLCDSVRRILGPAMRLTCLAHKHGQPAAETGIEHAAILQAVLSRDPDAAEQEMRHHIALAKERTLSRF
jgi:DNA-binding GntR family transcriptional regulator